MSDIVYRQYIGESDLPHIMALVQNELSEPYVIYTFRYFLHQWPHLAYLAYPAASSDSPPIGVIVCKQSTHRHSANRGYIAMLSVNKLWRKRGIALRYGPLSPCVLPIILYIARALVHNSIKVMKEHGVDEVVLETEYDNYPALSLYESLGFIREKRLYRFYLNGKDAFRLVLSIPHPPIDDDDDTEEGLDSRASAFPAVRRHRTPYPSTTPFYEDDEEISSR